MAVLFALSKNPIIVKMFRFIVGTDPRVRPKRPIITMFLSGMEGNHQMTLSARESAHRRRTNTWVRSYGYAEMFFVHSGRFLYCHPERFAEQNSRQRIVEGSPSVRSRLYEILRAKPSE